MALGPKRTYTVAPVIPLTLSAVPAHSGASMICSPISVENVCSGYAERSPPTTKGRYLTMGMKVWIDQDLCTGDGLCEEIAPDVFTLLDDGLAYVKEGDKVFSDPGGSEVSPTSPLTKRKRSSSPPRSAPASASTSRSSSAQPVQGPVEVDSSRWVPSNS